ncbi:tumor necrosis factor receptor superfamily member 1A isoform X2 [Boleophthalmus pectinirostris]|uniref:tumor necrosis factor receptor superfamily member 1A isoform X2 n=1 Tax=Boleophthalmus pectinirostris TaxID=150288 RepID=UPI00243163A6|nr:tumor necrosis factor receptor superfamily member 1A isoform X2 [Boleophthalmus pectinirostris]
MRQSIMSLVCALILLFISKSLVVAQPEKCQQNPCPPGYYRKKCGPDNSWNLCQKCKDGYYMDTENTARTCIQCTKCGVNTVMKKQCTSVSDRQCVSKGSDRNLGCSSCLTTRKKHTEPQRVVECNPLCILLTTHDTTAVTTNTTTTTISATTRGASNVTTKYICVGPLVWVLVFVVLLILVFCVSVLLLTNLYKYVHVYCPCWRVKEHAEAPLQADREPGCLQSPTTLVQDFTIYEEIPMFDAMSPVPPRNPANGAPQLSEEEHRALLDQTQREPFPAIVMYAVIKEVPLRRWKELMRLLSVADQQLERVELDVGLSSMEKQYQQLRLWSQKPGAKMDDIYSALHYMELMRCAQMIRESLDQIQQRPEGDAV